MINAVLFDLDGTFADTAPDLGAALNHVRAQHDLPPLPTSISRYQASHGARGLLKLGLDIEPDAPQYEAIRTEFLRYYENNICTYTTLFSGIAELISILEQRAIPWGIVTNKPHQYTVPLIEQLGYSQRASCLVSGDTCTHAKPHPMPLLHAAQIINTAPEQCLYLGDDLRDMQAAQAANMTGIIANYGYITPGTDINTWPSQGNIHSPLSLLSYI